MEVPNAVYNTFLCIFSPHWDYRIPMGFSPSVLGHTKSYTIHFVVHSRLYTLSSILTPRHSFAFVRAIAQSHPLQVACIRAPCVRIRMPSLSYASAQPPQTLC